MGDRYGRDTYCQRQSSRRPKPVVCEHCRGCPLVSINRRQHQALEVSLSRNNDEDDEQSGGNRLCEEDTDDIATCSSPSLLQPPPPLIARSSLSRAAASRCRCGLFRNGNIRNGVHNKINSSKQWRRDEKDKWSLAHNEKAHDEEAADDDACVVQEDGRSPGKRGDTSIVWEDEKPGHVDNVDGENGKDFRIGGSRDGLMPYPDKSGYKQNLSRRNTSVKRSKKKRRSRETVILNVGGQTFETYRSTLRRLRTPIFNSDAALQRYFRRSHGDYFFDRDATAFSSVLNFLRTGELHIPTNMCGPALQVSAQLDAAAKAFFFHQYHCALL